MTCCSVLLPRNEGQGGSAHHVWQARGEQDDQPSTDGVYGSGSQPMQLLTSAMFACLAGVFLFLFRDGTGRFVGRLLRVSQEDVGGGAAAYRVLSAIVVRFRQSLCRIDRSPAVGSSILVYDQDVRELDHPTEYML